jgi:V-type H+-transporting ATPase subunit D
MTAMSKQDKIVGLVKGGAQVSKCRERFTSLLDDIVTLASLQTSLKTLDEALKVTNRRVNALEFVVMPKLVASIKYVISELDEMEREDTFRIKKIKDMRVKIAEAQEKDRCDVCVLCV